MPFPQPVQAVLSPPNGEPFGSSRPDQKRLRNFIGLSPNQPTLASPAASRGEDVIYEVYEFPPRERLIAAQRCEVAATAGKPSETTL
jgi:hypothetical protein